MENNIEESQEEKIEKEIHILDYLIVLAKRKKLILLITISLIVLAIVHTFIKPPLYVAQARILSPNQSNRGGINNLLNQLPELGIIGSSGLNINSPDVLIEILYTRPVLDKVIEKLKANGKYKEINDWKMIKSSLRGMVIAESENRFSQIISITSMNENPVMAADIANTFTEALNERLQEISITQASQRRLFFEKQLDQAKENLIKAEEDMMEFQEKTKIYKVDTQAEAVLNSIANLRAKIAAKEVEIRVMKTYSTADNPDLQREKEILKGLKTELAKLEEQEGANPDNSLTVSQLPAVSRDYIRKYRELKFNEKLFELMLNQYELAKIEESKNPSIVQVIEEAIPPAKYVRRFKKKVLIALFGGLFISIFLAFFIEYVKKIPQDQENSEKLAILKSYFSFRKKSLRAKKLKYNRNI